MTLSEMRQVLAERDLRLTRSLGQNFLHDGNQLRRIVEAAALTKEDKVLEIGPGLGPLTELLLGHAGEVLAIEKDGRLVSFLSQRFEAWQTLRQSGEKPVPAADPATALHLVHDDALEFLRRESRDWSDWKLVSNLPYSVASPILVELAQSSRGPKRMIVTLQSEVARRLVAQPRNSDYGLLTLLVQLRYEPCGFFRIPASCFFPEPDVGSGCVTLIRRAPPLLPDEEALLFTRLVKRAFSQRRKMMLKLLKQDWPASHLNAALDQLGLSPQVRAEEVGLEAFVGLTRLLARSRATQCL